MTDQETAPEVPESVDADADAGSNQDHVVGAKIRGRRKIKKMSLTTLAAETGVSIGFLSQIERGLTSPSLQLLRKIASALDMPFSWLFSEGSPEDSDSDIVVRHADRRKLAFPHFGLDEEILTQDTEGVLQIIVMNIQPGGNSGDTPFDHRGEVAGVILSGEVELHLDGRVVRLSKDDSYRFKSHRSQKWFNKSSEDASILTALTPPFY